MTDKQKQATIFISLSVVALFAIWVIVVTWLVRAEALDARHGLGWMLAAAISSYSELKVMLAGVATIILAGLAAAGSLQRPGKMTYATGALVAAAIIASLMLLWLLSEPSIASQIRGTTPFDNIRTRQQFEPAMKGFVTTLTVSLAAALASMLGVSLWQGKSQQ